MRRLALLFEEAVGLSETKRAAFLRDRTQDERERAELEELLHSDRVAGSYLEEPAVPQIADLPAPASSPAAELPIPDRVGGYTVERILGTGSMGIVYLARQESTGQLVALKLMRPDGVGRRSEQRFQREMRILARLDHPGIARIVDAGRTDIGNGEQPFFAMEYVDGEPLREFARGNAPSLRRRVELIVELCEAMHHAHELGVLHRDLKSENILVDRRGQVRVLDFGIARISDPELQVTVQGTQEAQIIGTLATMSPEQATGDVRNLDRRSDVYSLGVVAYELIAGRLPLDLSRRTLLEAARIVQEREPELISSVREEVPYDLALVIQTALAKDPAYRYASARAMAADLGRWLRNEPITARPVGTIYILRKLARRHRGAAIGAAVAVIALVVGMVLSLVLANRANRSAATARWKSTLAELAAAGAELRAGALEQAQFRLRAIPPDDRGLEWRLLRHLSDPSALVLEGQEMNIWNVAITPDGKRALSAAGDGTVFEWALDRGREPRRLTDHNERVFSVAASADGTRVASGSADRTIHLRDAATLETLAVLEGHDAGCFALAFSPDGELLASGANDGTLRTWDAGNGAPRAVLEGHGARIWELAFSPEGDTLATVSEDGEVGLWDPRSGRRLGRLRPNTGALVDLSFSPDGERLALASVSGRLQLWDFARRTRLRETTASATELGCCAFSPDGTLILTGSREGGLGLWDGTDLSPRGVLRAHADWLQDLAFTPDGKRLVSSSWDDTLRVWRTSRLYEHLAPERRNGRCLAAGPGSSDLFVLDGDELRLEEVGTGSVLAAWTIEGERHRATAGRRGKLIALNVSGAPTRIIDTEAGTVRDLARGMGPIALSRDGKRLATSVQPNRDLQVIDPRTGACIAVLDSYGPDAVSLCFDATGDRVLVTGDPDCAVHVFDAITGAHRDRLEGHVNTIRSMELDRSGELLATASADRTCRVWDLRTGACVGTLGGHGSSVVAATFNEASTRVVTLTDGGTIRIWNWPPGEALARIETGLEDADSLFFSRDGRFLIVGSRLGQSVVLDAR
ncbi:MAG TPA: hypothetical protein ENJ09_05960 [Planctomycetes bacterium]|nr:hypothetical protein [Planctomycetota bacterium]